MVAAWMRADTGVGPSMASGSQMNSGICADLPVRARNRSSDGGRRRATAEVWQLPEDPPPGPHSY